MEMIRIPSELLNRLNPKTGFLTLGSYYRQIGRYFAIPLEWLQAFFRVLWACGLLLLISFLGFWVFTQTTQARDVFLSIGTDYQLAASAPGFIYRGHLPFFWSTLLYSLLLWYSGRIVLHTIHLSRTGEPAWDRKVIFFKTWLPRLFSSVPFAVNALAFAAVDFPAAVLWNLVFSAGIFLVLSFRLTFVRLLQSLLPDRFTPGNQMVGTGRRLNEIAAAGTPLYRLPVLPFFLLGAQLLVGILFSMEVSKPVWTALGAPAIFQLALSGSLMLIVFVTFLNHRSAYLFSIIAVAVLTLFSLNNQKHEINLMGSPSTGIQREEINYNFYKWLEEKVKNRPSDQGEPSSIPVFIVAAEGGGSKALNWTSLVMAQLRSLQDDHFSEHIYALTGTSGGAGGLIFDQALNRDRNADRSSGANLTEPHLQSLDDDLLTPLTGSLCYPDMIQRLLPISVNRLDRTRCLEESWEETYRNSFRGAGYSLNNAFLSLWRNQDKREPVLQIPNLLLNTCKSGTYEKMIISNLKLSSNYFPETIDFHDQVQQDISLKTAAAITAKYPFLRSSGKICSGQGDQASRKCLEVTDAGFQDNSSLQTAVQLLLLMKESSLTFQSETGNRVKLGLIYIRNSEDHRRKNTPHDDRAWDSRGIVGQEIKDHPEVTVDLIQRLSKPELLDFDFFQFTLNQEPTVSATASGQPWNKGQQRTVPIPDGWYLSKTAKAEILKQAKQISYSPEEIIRQFPDQTIQDKTAIQNALNFERLRGSLTN
ncbi:hypothetical protein [Flavilitoribacter nigricans]|uniref:PNPLA domain-containing protein n=1 Tax=Flavilitoribacter nigricans (strain ATCC 23147 / DSM 23189 / NBRC 102662 / NCIMB 1420 / SS-2) TaxID=1122177 RepID=A0A2D0NBZ3_FLAN2|nr:hypothetical protein [Flavilitoribacter nigricans]PHN05699.1 hypothetical protein CRP01_14575 [Flavilitoribacter nigricans DSM 23189 = NBRC 102662]